MARRLVAALWILALPVLLWATDQSAPSEHRFPTLVAQYRGGDAKAAIAELAQWDAKRLKDEAVIGLDEPVLTMAGAALLHLEAALQRGAALPAGMRSVDRSLDVAYPLVQAVARRSRDNPTLRDFSRNWYICALSMCLQRRGTWFYGYYPLLLSAQTEFPNDPRILMTAASGATPQCIGCSELCGTERDTAQGLPSDWNIEDATRKVFHQSAEQLLRKALAVDPGLVEARVRLGRLLQTNGRLEESRIELERARDEAMDPSLVYLAALFLGRTHEEAGRVDKARASYELAVQTLPTGQAGYLALGTLLVSTGRTGEGWTAIRRVFGEGDRIRNPEREPTWTFDGAEFSRVDSMIASMRIAVGGR